MKALQKILNDNGASHIRVLDRNTLETTVDDELTVFYRNDTYGGHPLSGWATFGSMGGDHRMIRGIAEDIEAAFDLIS